MFRDITASKMVKFSVLSHKMIIFTIYHTIVKFYKNNVSPFLQLLVLNIKYFSLHKKLKEKPVD